MTQPLEQDAREFRLLALHAIGMAGGIRNAVKIELREHAVLPGAILKAWRLESLRDQRRGGSERIEHIEGGRMESRGA